MNKENMNLETGHPAIDKQHQHLAQLVESLDSVCEIRRKTGTACLKCVPDCSSLCSDRLANLISELLSFMLDHFMYEEKLMRLLPDTEECRNHVEGHMYAHAEISRLLSQLTANLARTDPMQSSLRLQNIVNGWLGQHAIRFDSPLSVSLEGAYDAEIDFDKELSRLLGG